MSLDDVVRFGTFEFDRATGELWSKGRRVPLQDQPAQLLSLLVSRPGTVVTREELRKALWSEDTFVEFDTALNVAVNKIRQALRDSASTPRFAETVPKRGYRFLADVHRAGTTAAPPRVVVQSRRHSGSRATVDSGWRSEPPRPRLSPWAPGATARQEEDTMAKQAVISLDYLHCHQNGELTGAEPYMFTAFFKVDGETVSIAAAPDGFFLSASRAEADRDGSGNARPHRPRGQRDPGGCRAPSPAPRKAGRLSSARLILRRRVSCSASRRRLVH